MEAKMSSLPTIMKQFSLDEILSATNNFDDALVVGEGGFGKVYKATIDIENDANVIVAIKRLDPSSNQGAPEFWAEIEMLTKLRHCNLVSLIGYCNDNLEMILIYEFMSNGTLDGHLHRYGTSLTWVQRLNISIGAARGLHYLLTGTGTQHGVIHRDVKSTNILLDKDYVAKISDFGLSKIGTTTTSGTYYVNTLIRGTFGYLDPEYYLTGRLTRKSDVFSFGVVLFELLCGRVALDRSLDDDTCSLAKWAHESIEKGKVYEIIDFNINSQISPKCLKVFVRIADRCVSSESTKRPTMAEIVVALEHALSLQNTFNTHIKSYPGMLAFARMIKWPFISPNANSAQTKSDRLEATSAGKSQILVHDLKKFSLDELKNATRDFTHDLRLGGGMFGEVFKGYIDTNTSPMSIDGVLKIAIRRYDHHKIDHCHLKEEFVDMAFLNKFNHPNLVKILGYCLEDEQLFLIYEFMENGSLYSHLITKDKMPLPWNTRVKIAVGIAEALLVLERTQKPVDIYPIMLHNILLDKNFNPKISNYECEELANKFPIKAEMCDPLYYHAHAYIFGIKDVSYAFGDVLVRILTGERDNKIGTRNLNKHMKNQTGKPLKERLRRVLDPRLPNVDDTTIENAIKLVDVALSCLDNEPRYTMKSALDVLRKL